MRSINLSDASAIRSAFNRDGVSAAISEVMRRWPGIDEIKAKDVLQVSLDMTMTEANQSGKISTVRDITTARRHPRW